jgi:hypothetical protein
MINPIKKTNASTRFSEKETKITKILYIMVKIVMISYAVFVYEKNLPGVNSTIHKKRIPRAPRMRKDSIENLGKSDCINNAKAGTARYHERYSSLSMNSQLIVGKR